jgi:hypothetical protein
MEFLILCVASRLALDVWLPSGDSKGFWFYTALLGLVLGTRLDTPFFVKPADAVINAVTAMVALILAGTGQTWDEGRGTASVIVVGIYALVIVCGACAIIGKDSRKASWQRVSNGARVLTEVLGSPRCVFTILIGFALYAFHASSARELAWVGAAWAATAFVRPLDVAFNMYPRLYGILRPGSILLADGEIVGHQTPSIMLIRQTAGAKLNLGDILAVNDPHGQIQLALVMDQFGRDDGVLVRAIRLDTAMPDNMAIGVPVFGENCVAVLPEVQSLPKAELYKRSIVGLVAPDTSIERLNFEVVRDNGLEEGRLVEVQIGEQAVIYQVVNGATREEIVQQRNTSW